MENVIMTAAVAAALGFAAGIASVNRSERRAEEIRAQLLSERETLGQIVDALDEECVNWTPAEDPTATAGITPEGVYAPEGECVAWCDEE